MYINHEFHSLFWSSSFLALGRELCLCVLLFPCQIRRIDINMYIEIGGTYLLFLIGQNDRKNPVLSSPTLHGALQFFFVATIVD